MGKLLLYDWYQVFFWISAKITDTNFVLNEQAFNQIKIVY